MNRFVNHPRALFITCIILGVLLIGIVVIYGVSATTRGPLEMLLALLIGALLLFFRAWSQRRSG